MREKNKELASLLESIISDEDMSWNESNEGSDDSPIMRYECKMVKITFADKPYAKFKVNQWNWGNDIKLEQLGYGWIQLYFPFTGLKTRLKKIVAKQYRELKEMRENKDIDDTITRIKENPEAKKYLRSSKLEDLGI